MGERKKILVVAKTYPLPSIKYRELVCTGGVLEGGTFIRLYPLNFRYRSFDQQFRKYQWIEVDVEKNLDDPRPESYKPVPGTKIKRLGEPLSTKNSWEARKRYVLAKGVRTMCELKGMSSEECSLGIIKPAEVMDVKVEQAAREWKSEWAALFRQYSLFGDDRKPLEKIPYTFKYIYKCHAPDCRGHTMMDADWEVSQLYRRMRDKYGDEEVAVEKVRHQLFDVRCGSNIDTHFFVGTTRRYGSYIVVGVFWPKKI